MTTAEQLVGSALANESINLGGMIVANGFMANSDNVTHFGKVIGYASELILPGNRGPVIISGMVENPNWSFQYSAPIFLNGRILSATPPVSGFSQQVGIAQGPTSVLIELREPILI